MLLSDSIRSARKKLGMTQGELASLVDVSVPAVSAWERGVAAPRPEKLTLVLDALGLPDSDYTSPPPPEKSDMTWDEANLLSNYWACDPETKMAILTMAREGARKTEGKEGNGQS